MDVNVANAAMLTDTKRNETIKVSKTNVSDSKTVSKPASSSFPYYTTRVPEISDVF